MLSLSARDNPGGAAAVSLKDLIAADSLAGVGAEVELGERRLRLGLSWPASGPASLEVEIYDDAVEVKYVGGPPEPCRLMDAIDDALSSLHKAGISVPRIIGVLLLGRASPLAPLIPVEIPALVHPRLSPVVPRDLWVYERPPSASLLRGCGYGCGRISVTLATDGSALLDLDGNVLNSEDCILAMPGGGVEELVVARYRRKSDGRGDFYMPMFRSRNAILGLARETPLEVCSPSDKASELSIFPKDTAYDLVARSLVWSDEFELLGVEDLSSFADDVVAALRGAADGLYRGQAIGRLYGEAILKLAEDEGFSIERVAFSGAELIAVRGSTKALYDEVEVLAAITAWADSDWRVAISRSPTAESLYQNDIPTAMAMQLAGVESYTIVLRENEIFSGSDASVSPRSKGSRGEPAWVYLAVSGEGSTLDASRAEVSPGLCGLARGVEVAERAVVDGLLFPFPLVGAPGVAVIQDVDGAVILARSKIAGALSVIVHPGGVGLFGADYDDILRFVLEESESEALAAAVAVVASDLLSRA